MQRSVPYTLVFSAIVCIVCSLLVSGTAVGLRSRQEANARLDKQRNVLEAIGYLEPGEAASGEKIEELFASVEPALVDLESGEYSDKEDALTYDMQAAMGDPARSRNAAPNRAQVARVPRYGLVYKVVKEGRLEMVVLPIQGKGLWSTLYGFLALDSDGTTVRGITYYQHGETPGLGGEVDNPAWKRLWKGRKVFDESGEVAIEVVKGKAGPPDKDPHEVDGLSGATLTSRGVTHMLHFWVGQQGFGPYLDKLREQAR